MKLTDRLLKIASLVDNGKRIADIGTDHGYIPVYLLNQNKIQYAILGDVNKGPLENARKEVTRNKLQDKVDLRLGMGGMLINNLLKANEKVAHTTEKLILQPMQAPEELRMFLYQNGYKILDEHLVREEHRLYEIIVCKYEGLEPQEIDPIYYEIGLKLIQNNDPLLNDFIENKIRINQNVLKKLEGKEGQGIEDKRAALNKKIDALNDLLNK